VSAEFWIVLTGALAATSCALVGCFLVLRRMAMLGDAISHAVLPGIAIAFFLSNSRAPLPMLIGAGALGLLTALAIELLHRGGKLQQDASIGVTFTWMFAVGVILISLFAGQVDLDQECVLYGEIAYVPWDLWTLPSGASMGPRAVWILGFALLFNLAWVLLAWKELKICAFDPELAASLGIPVAAFHYLLMAATSITTVTAFESVGAILVVALIVGPPATAYLITDRLAHMVAISVGVGIACAAAGYMLARAVDGSIAGAIAVAIGAAFTLALLFSPTHGVVVRAWRRRAIGRAALASDRSEIPL